MHLSYLESIALSSDLFTVTIIDLAKKSGATLWLNKQKNLNLGLTKSSRNPLYLKKKKRGQV
jgi:hypothetical protein